MLCTACGYENQVGNRFCGMCGMPLPHRPLTAPGAQGTHSFTRVPLESAKLAEHDPATTSAEKASGPAAPSRTGVLIEMPSAESRTTETSRPENFVPSAVDMVPEVPLDEYVKSFRYVPPADPGEITMRGEAEVLQPEVPVPADASPTVPAETATAADTSSISPAEDVRERLGLEDSTAGDERRDRPRFLDFSEPALPLEKPEAPESAIEDSSFLDLSDTPPVAAQPANEAEAGKPSRGSWLTWAAVAAFLVFAALGLLEWRSQVNQTNDGPVEVVKTKFRGLMSRYSSPPQSADSADANAARPVMQAEEQPKSLAQDQAATANPNAPGATSTNSAPAASDANAGTGAASPLQSTTLPAGNPLPAGQKTAAPVPSSSVNGTSAATGQKTSSPKPTPPASTAKVAIASEANDIARPATEKPKPKLQTAQEDDQEVIVKKIVPGEDELTKANNASDSVAAAAWLWKATAKGNPDAPVRLADLYVKGDGVPRSCEQALVLLKTAATKENARARNRLAAMYNSGTCVQRNRVEAYRWLSSALAADPNSHWAQQNRKLIWQQMTLDERAAAQQYRSAGDNSQ